MINLVVFSKNRPMQLQALLDSIRLNAKGVFSPVTVVYKADSEEYENGYKLLMERMPWAAIYKRQDDFKNDIMSAIDNSTEFTCFAADDDIVFDKFNEGLLKCFDDSDVCCFSLRLGKNIDHCYSNDKPNKLEPEYEYMDEFLKWKWAEQSLDFGYPLSVVSHIFRTKFIKELTDKISFKNPNTYEAELQALVQECKPKMASYKQSKIVGVPANSVNSSWTNRNGLIHSYSTEELVDKYLYGQIIDIEYIKMGTIHSAQQEIEYVFKQI